MKTRSQNKNFKQLNTEPTTLLKGQVNPHRLQSYGKTIKNQERLSAITLKEFRRLLGLALIKMDTLRTLIAEKENIFIDRLLTYVSTDNV